MVNKLRKIKKTIFVPILAILERTKIKNFFKLIITLGLTFIISFIYIMLNLTIVF